ncbi:hypothetical protein C6P46_000738 [Rhodotorula mucilaginosa]|uniref:Uncharacterized protein n=1 Tax=Rhodotorula mucilaginosa TaxID=5537 RepID=A0A9P6VWB0_RHOMI|nr:hypothetical protein C6P46_000738 [Rhodotorula mucilaginosa]
MATTAYSTVRIKVEDRGEALADQIADRQQELPYRSTNFFDETNSFESAADFFEQARIRLLKDCGYEAKPSKNKSTKASHPPACPVENQLEQQHVVPLAQTEAGAETRPDAEKRRTSIPGTDPPRTGSGSSRTVVLYDETARFSSIDAFYAQTRKLSVEKYDVRCSPHHHSPDAAVASCLFRQVCRCPYRIRAKRSGADFVVDLDRTTWEHNHERGSREAVAPGIPTGKMPKLERSDGDSRNYDSALEDDAASEGEQGGGAEDDQTAETTGPELAIVPPAAPKVGDQFKDLDEGYVAFAIANTQQLGSGRGCPFKAVFGPVGNRCTVLPTSVLYHSHDTNPKLLADPTWRPLLRCKVVLAAFAKLDRQNSQSVVVDSKPELPWPSVPKRPRLSEPTAPASSWTVRTAADPPTSAPRPSLPPPPHMGSSGARRPQTQTGTTTVSAINSHSHVNVATPSIDSSRKTSLFSPGTSANVHSQVGTVGTSLPPEQHKPAPLRTDSDLVASFLAGLDVALVPLAKHLVDAGVDSLDALVHLASLSAGPRQALLEQLHKLVIVRDPDCPSPLRLLPLLANMRA